MYIIGVTGGIGSGKSEVSRILRALGAEIIDADIVAREIVKKGERALEEIIKAFGTDILTNGGELNRGKLGAIVFGDPKKLTILNEITHKYIIEKIRLRIQELTCRGVKASVIDAAIPFEKGFQDQADEIWVVIAEKETRIRRIMARNGLSYEDAVRRIESQMAQEEYMDLADKLIENNEGINELADKVRALFFDIK